MQQRRAVAVEHALGVAGGAAGIAKRSGTALLEHRPVASVAFAGDPRLVAAQALDAAVLRQRRVVAQGDPVAHRLALAPDRLHQRQEGHVEGQCPVFGMVDDPHQLLGRQTRVQGVDDPPAARNAEIQLDVSVTVPGQGGEPVAELQTQPLDCCRDLARAQRGVAVRVTVGVAFDAARDDLGVVVVARGELDQARDRQRQVLHRAQHAHVLDFESSRPVLRPASARVMRDSPTRARARALRRQCGP